MIRIDEIYYNIFVKALQDRTAVALHWFDPFGSVRYEDMCCIPKIDYGYAERRIVFWDQEPVYRDTADDFFSKFAGDISGLHFDGKKAIVTSEKNSADLDWLCDTYDLDSVYYFFHGWAALDWYRGYDHSFLIAPWHKRKFQHPLFIPNNIIGGRRQHRLELLAELHARDSIKMNRISFPEICPYEKIDSRDLAKRMGVDIDGVDLPLIIDRQANHANHSSRIDFWDQASDCFCHVITETVYRDRLHITEKTFKPIVMQQPFILLGSRNGLSYLRDYGFKTFDGIWDESYDTLPDDQRLQAVADLCGEISNWSSSRIVQAQEQARSIIEHNFNWFYGDFQDVLWQELTGIIEKLRC